MLSTVLAVVFFFNFTAHSECSSTGGQLNPAAFDYANEVACLTRRRRRRKIPSPVTRALAIAICSPGLDAIISARVYLVPEIATPGDKMSTVHGMNLVGMIARSA
jgi:hypothetical protein